MRRQPSEAGDPLDPFCLTPTLRVHKTLLPLQAGNQIACLLDQIRHLWLDALSIVIVLADIVSDIDTKVVPLDSVYRPSSNELNCALIIPHSPKWVIGTLSLLLSQPALQKVQTWSGMNNIPKWTNLDGNHARKVKLDLFGDTSYIEYNATAFWIIMEWDNVMKTTFYMTRQRYLVCHYIHLFSVCVSCCCVRWSTHGHSLLSFKHELLQWMQCLLSLYRKSDTIYDTIR